MEERLISNASFSKVCKILQNKKSYWEEFKPILRATMLIIPVLINKDYVTAVALREALEQGITWLDSGEIIECAVTGIKNLINKPDEDYVTRAENAQIANVLLVFSAYFDTVKVFLPDKQRKIYLDDVQYSLTEKSLRDYREKLLARENIDTDADCRKIAEWNLVLPNPLEGLDEYEKRLKEFYILLNSSFSSYLEGLACTEELQENLRGELNRRLEKIPDAAVGSYKAQYYSLAAICPDFFVWTNQQEHRQQIELVDRGFKSLSEQIKSIPEAINEYHASEALIALQSRYSRHRLEPIIPIKDMPPQDREMRIPTKEESFVPQAYEWLIYRERISLEATQQWKDGGAIGPDILSILRSPELGSKPVLLLGDPGAGKTMLCHMLAGKILCGEYHVIVLHLRDLNAELSIAEQISQEIAQTLDDGDCKWGNIARAKPKKPVLLIFDGYDELLQASGKTYSNYLQKILEFQENQWKSRGITVRSIVTSRIVLIDKVEVPINSVVMRLRPFDKYRIDEWCKVWNAANEAYFVSRGLDKFEVEQDSKAWELAGEPLLLLMLALFDTKDNALRKHQNLQATELYGSLIRDFVEREKKKNPIFEAKEHRDRKREIEKEIERISIAALGMYSRNSLHITSGQLENDLALLTSVNTSRELRDSEQLLGSFFFVHDLTTRAADVEEKEKLRAYTFLHNTFGEFLAAYYIVLQLYNLLDDLKHHVEKYDDAAYSLKDRKGWYACLSYAPLFRRPVVGQMIREWTPQYFCEKKLELEDAVAMIKELLHREVPRVMHGKVFSELEAVSGQFQSSEKKENNDLMEHLAVYSNNILSLAALVTDGVNLGEIEKDVPGTWDKLLHLWRYAFDENEIAAFAGQFEIAMQNDTPFLSASDVTVELQRENDRITKLYITYKNLHEEPSRSILGTLLGSESVSSLRQQNLRTEAKNILLGIMLGRAQRQHVENCFTHEEIEILFTYPQKCLTEGDYGSLYGYYLVLNDIAVSSIEGAKHIASIIDFEQLVEIYIHCSRRYPVTTIPILELLDNLLPVIRDEYFRGLLNQLADSHDFESRLSNRSMELWCNLLLQCMKRGEVGPWLNSCWKLVRHAEKHISRDPNCYSCETLEKLCRLTLEANQIDPTFPLDFLDEIRRWIDDNIYYDCLSVTSLPIVELLKKCQSKQHYNEICIAIDRIFDKCDCDPKLVDQSIRILADMLLEQSTIKDRGEWLNACWQLLKNAERYLLRDHNPYNEETVEKLFLLSLEISKKDQFFPLEFIYKYSLRIARRIQEFCRVVANRRTVVYQLCRHTDLAVLIITLDIMQTCEYAEHGERYLIVECADSLLQIMGKAGVYLFGAWKDRPQIVLSICHTVHMYSEESREYMLKELKALVRNAKTGISLELCRELNIVAEKYENKDLKKELMRL